MEFCVSRIYCLREDRGTWVVILWSRFVPTSAGNTDVQFKKSLITLLPVVDHPFPLVYSKPSLELGLLPWHWPDVVGWPNLMLFFLLSELLVVLAKIWLHKLAAVWIVSRFTRQLLWGLDKTQRSGCKFRGRCISVYYQKCGGRRGGRKH